MVDQTELSILHELGYEQDPYLITTPPVVVVVPEKTAREKFAEKALATAQVLFIYEGGWTVVGPMFAWNGPESMVPPAVTCPVVDCRFRVILELQRGIIAKYDAGPKGLKDIDTMLAEFKRLGAVVTQWVEPIPDDLLELAKAGKCKHPDAYHVTQDEGEVYMSGGETIDTRKFVTYCRVCGSRIKVKSARRSAGKPTRRSIRTNAIPF